MNPRRHIRRTLLAAVAAGLAAVAGAAAFWSGEGDGRAVQSIDVIEPLLLAPAEPTAELYPGGSTTVSVRVDNPNPVQLLVPSLELDMSALTPIELDVASAAAGCSASSLTFTGQDNGGQGWFIPPQAGDDMGTRTIDLPLSLQMQADAANGCQSARIAVHLVVGS